MHGIEAAVVKAMPIVKMNKPAQNKRPFVMKGRLHYITKACVINLVSFHRTDALVSHRIGQGFFRNGILGFGVSRFG